MRKIAAFRLVKYSTFKMSNTKKDCNNMIFIIVNSQNEREKLLKWDFGVWVQM